MQEFTSCKTSVRIVPRAFKLCILPQQSLNFDVGGGRYDDATEYLKKHGIENLVYDPFNRSSEHNTYILNRLNQQKADSASVLNVLNVIKETEIQQQTLCLAANFIKTDGLVIIQIWQGNRTGKGSLTIKGWQNNKVLKDYLEIVQSVFADVKLVQNVLVAKKSKV